MKEYEKYDLSESVRVSRQDLESATKNLQRYILGFDARLDAEANIAGVNSKFYNAREIFHMEDVKVLFTFGFTAMWISLVILAASSVYIITKKYFFDAAKWVIKGVAFLLATFGALAVVVAINFDRAFVIFHEIFFDNDLWLLDPGTDLLINMMPQQFFTDITLRIAINFIAGMAAVLTGCAVVAIKHRRAESAANN